MGGKKGENKNQGVGAGGVGPFRICNDNVCHWWAFGTVLIVGQTEERQGACGDCIIVVPSCQGK